MPRLRKGIAYRRIERPYTRISKYREKSYIRANPQTKIIRFHMGEARKKFPFVVKLISKSELQIRDNALESARQAGNRLLETGIGLTNYHMKIMPYPFHVLRENPLAQGAGADRFSTGMQKAFGKPIGRAARIKKGQTLIEVDIDKANVELAKKALNVAKTKLPCSCTIQIFENK